MDTNINTENNLNNIGTSFHPPEKDEKEVQWINIFRSGNNKSNNGETRYYSTNDIDNIIFNFVNSKDGVPLTLGHPPPEQSGRPAVGQIKELRRINNILQARIEHIDPLKEWIEQGMYKNYSVGIGMDDTGMLFLDHVAILGEKLPALKDLAKGPLKFFSDSTLNDIVNFGEDDNVVVDKHKEDIKINTKVENFERKVEPQMENEKEVNRSEELEAKSKDLEARQAELLKFEKELIDKQANQIADASRMEGSRREMFISMYNTMDHNQKIDFNGQTMSVSDALTELTKKSEENSVKTMPNDDLKINHKSSFDQNTTSQEVVNHSSSPEGISQFNRPQGIHQFNATEAIESGYLPLPKVNWTLNSFFASIRAAQILEANRAARGEPTLGKNGAIRHVMQAAMVQQGIISEIVKNSKTKKGDSQW